MHREKSLRLRVIVFVILLCCCSSAHADVLNLKYKIEKTIEKNASNSKKSVKTTRKVSVNRTFVLDRNAFAISSEDETLQVDFDKRRIRHLNHQARTIRDVSLYPELCNRDMTMQRQYLIRKELIELKKKFETNIDSFTLSCIFGLPFPESSNPVITCTEYGKTVTFRYNGRVVTTVTFSDIPVSDLYADSYSKAILYQWELHPLVRKRITQRKMVIESLSYNLELFDSNDLKSRERRRTTIRLAGTSNGTSNICVPDNYKITFSSGSPLQKLQERIFLRDRALELPEKDRIVSQAQELIAKKKRLEAFLCLTEFGIETGKDGQAAMKIINEKLRNEPLIERLAKLQSAKTAQEVDSALSELDKIKEQASLKRYIIEVFKGNIARHSNTANADQMFLNALEQNPLLTETYIDLGTYYKFRNQVGLAWDCFDLARQVCPDHPTLNAVKSLEKDLVDRHPEYF